LRKITARVRREVPTAVVYRSKVTQLMKEIPGLRRKRAEVAPAKLEDPVVRKNRLENSTHLLETLTDDDFNKIICADEWTVTNRDGVQRSCYGFENDSGPSKGMEMNLNSVKVWAAIGVGYKKLIILNKKVTSTYLIRRCLSQTDVKQALQQRLLLHDNWSVHRGTEEWMEKHKVKVVPWAAYSPDLNPVEHIFAILGPRVAAHAATSRDELIKAVETEFEALDQLQLDKIVMTFRSKLESCVLEKGGLVTRKSRKKCEEMKKKKRSKKIFSPAAR
jgi:transposase